MAFNVGLPGLNEFVGGIPCTDGSFPVSGIASWALCDLSKYGAVILGPRLYLLWLYQLFFYDGACLLP